MKSKKELKDIYKEQKSRIGVFQIRNITNNKIFVEWSSDLQTIWNRHRFQLNSGMHPNILLQKDWNEFGQDHFSFEILSEIKQEDLETSDFRKEAKELELMFIEELEPFDERGYNTKKLG